MAHPAADTNDHRTDPEKNDAAPDGHSSTTQSQQGGASLPRMPHERDESSARPEDQEKSAANVGKQAMKDAEGSADTGRGPVMDEVYNDKVRP